MGRPYGDDLRRKYLHAYDQGEGTHESLADRFCVSVAWAKKISAQRNRTGQAERVLHHPGRKLAVGIEAPNLLPAMDLATAQLNPGASHDARVLLGRISAYLDGPSALRLPLFTFERARVHALAGEPDAALRALDRAYNEGLRTTWALDLRPQSFLYIDPLDADPAFGALLDDPRFISWRERIREDNARQLERLRVHATVRSPT